MTQIIKTERKIPLPGTKDNSAEISKTLEAMQLFEKTYQFYERYGDKNTLESLRQILGTIENYTLKAGLGRTLQEIKRNAYSQRMDFAMTENLDSPLAVKLKAIEKLSEKINSQCRKLDILPTISEEKQNPKSQDVTYQFSERFFGKKRRPTTSREIAKTRLDTIPEKAEFSPNLRYSSNSCLIS